MKIEFSQTLAWRTIIVCCIIQLFISILNSTFIVHSLGNSSWLVSFISYIIMISYIVSCSSYRFKALKYDLKRLKNREVIGGVLLVFMTQYFISSGGYQVVLSLLFYVNESLATHISHESLISFTDEKDLFFAFLTISLVVPIFEELLFRGVILDRLSQRFSCFWSLMYMSLCF